MTAMPKPTDSVLRRHYERNLQTEWSSASPQDSMLIRHHEQMRAAWHDGAERKPPEALPKSSVSSVVQHPLAIHLEIRSDRPPPAGIRPAPTARSSQARTAANLPPDDSTLARHYAQQHDRSFAEHPLAAHLRQIARQGSKISVSTVEAPTGTTPADRHPLAVHLEARPAMPGAMAVQSTPAARPTRTKTAPPEDSTLARHYAQKHDVSFGEHPLAAHLRMLARTSRATSAHPSSPTTSVDRFATATEVWPEDDPPTAAEKTGQKQPVRPEAFQPTAQPGPLGSTPDEAGWLRRLLRHISGRK